MKRQKHINYLIFAILLLMALTACSNGEITDIATPPPLTPTITPTEGPTATPTLVLPDTLVVCMGEEPGTLYTYGENTVASAQVLQAIYDGPIDTYDYSYHPVILQTLPSLENGDAEVKSVAVQEGDIVVDAAGIPNLMHRELEYYPAGCQSPDCVAVYEEGTVQMDQMVVTFRMLPDMLWSDGQPLTADDSVFSFQLASDPSTPSDKTDVERTYSYLKEDDQTVVWTGLPGYIDTDYFLNFWSPLPKHIWDAYTAAELLELADSNRAPLGWGPYVVSQWIPGVQIELTRNENYFRLDEGLPYFRNLIIRFLDNNPQENIAQAVTGECDLVLPSAVGSGEIDLMKELESAGSISSWITTGMVFDHLDFNIHHSGFDDGYNQWYDESPYFLNYETRQAVAMCIDRQRLVDEVLDGYSVMLDSYLPPNHPLYNPDIQKYPFDPDTAQTNLQDFGWELGSDGIRYASGIFGIFDETPLSISYYTSTNRIHSETSLLISEMLAECGVEVELIPLPTEEYFTYGVDAPLFGRDFDLAQYAWPTSIEPPCYLYLSESIPGDPLIYIGEAEYLHDIYPDVEFYSERAFPFGWGGWNTSGYVSAEFDTACKAAMNSLPGEESYVQNHYLAQEIFAQDLPVLPLYMNVITAASRPDLCGFELNSTDATSLWNLEGYGYDLFCDD